MTSSSASVALSLLLLALSCSILVCQVLALVRCWQHPKDPERTKWLWILFLVPVAGVVYLLRRKQRVPSAPTLLRPLAPAVLPAAQSARSSALTDDEQANARAISDSIAALGKSRAMSSRAMTGEPPGLSVAQSTFPFLTNTPVEQPPPLPLVLTPASAAADRPVGMILGLSLALCGVALLFTVTQTSDAYAATHPSANVLGYYVGSMVMWPLIVVGLFSIGRQFRNPRSRAIIVLVVWALSLLGQLGSFAQKRRDGSAPKPSIPLSQPTLPPAPSDKDDAKPSPVNTTSATSTPVAEAFDFTQGSDERLSKTIDSAREDRYHQIVAAYARACESRPKDGQLALERVRFIERFAWAEDFTIEGSDEDLKVALAWLNQRFPADPRTILHELERSFGAEFTMKAERHAGEAAQWSKPDHARFLLLRAQRAEDPEERWMLARRSYEREPSINAGLLYLENAGPNGASERIRILDDPVFQAATALEKRRMLLILFKAGVKERALALYDELKAQELSLTQSDDMAQNIADAGRVQEGREILAALTATEWNRGARLRNRFEFELKHGDSRQAGDAYRAMCRENVNADLFLTDRLSLFRRFPTSGWGPHDLVGLVALTLMLALLFLAPAIMIVPVHYWSLLRARRAKPSAWPAAHWGLREIWVACGTLLACEVFGIWIFAPAIVRAWSDPANKVGPAPTYTDAALIKIQCVAWVAMVVLLVVALTRGKAWHVVGRGNWTWRRVLGYAASCALGLRFLVGWYVTVWPQALGTEAASIPSLTNQLMLATLKSGGPLTLIATTALLVPFLEEVLFRGVILEGLSKHVPFGWANAIQAVCFAIAHENIGLLPFYVLFGVTCGWLARRSGGLLTSILVHAANNLIVCIALIARN